MNYNPLFSSVPPVSYVTKIISMGSSRDSYAKIFNSIAVNRPRDSPRVIELFNIYLSI